MTAVTVASLYAELEDSGVRIWIDGGWGVDALLGRQTRAHQDLDIAIEEGHVSRFRAFLEQRGYKEIKLEQARPWNFVLGDQEGSGGRCARHRCRRAGKRYLWTQRER